MIMSSVQIIAESVLQIRDTFETNESYERHEPSWSR